MSRNNSIFNFAANMANQDQGSQPLGSFPSENYGSEAIPSQSTPIMPTAPRPNPVGQFGNTVGGAGNAYVLGNSIFGGGEAAAAPAAVGAETGAFTLPTQLGIGGPTMAAEGASGAGAAGTTAAAGSMFGPAAIAAIGVAGTAAARDWARKQGDGTRGAWSVANAANPVNQALEVPGAFKNVTHGEKLDFGQQAALAIPTLGTSFFYNPIFGRGGLFGSSKGKDQVARDSVRHAAVDNKWFDEDYRVDLGNGLILDMGKDGGYKYTNADGTERRFNNIEEGDPNAPQAIGWLRPLALIMSEGDEKLTSDFVGQFYNELTKDGNAKDLATVRARVIDLYNKFGLKPSIVAASLEELKKRGMSEEFYQAALAATNNLKPGQKPQLQPGSSSGLTMGAPKDPNVKPPTGSGVIPKDVKNNASAAMLKALGTRG